MDVPLIVFNAVLLPIHGAVILLLGAKMSTHVPQLEKEDRTSVLVVEPTVIAVGSLAGDLSHASPLLLPAATTVVTPES